MVDLISSLSALQGRYHQLGAQMSDPEVIGSVRYQNILREHARLAKVMEPFNRLLKAQAERDAAQGLLADPDMREMAREEMAANDRLATALTAEITGLLVSSDAAASRDCILEIRAGTGGDEASLFAGDLARMYSLWTARLGMRIETMSLNEGAKGGFKEAIFGGWRVWPAALRERRASRAARASHRGPGAHPYLGRDRRRASRGRGG
jgi:peptide chain release factor 1